jgi:hypothetical protein
MLSPWGKRLRHTFRKLPKASPRRPAKIVPKMRIIFEVEYTAPHRGGGLRFEVSHLRRDRAAPTPFCDESTNSGLEQRQQVSPALRGWQVSRSPASSTPRGWNGSGKSEVPGFPPIPQSDAEWMGHGGCFFFGGFADVRGSTYMQLPQTLCGIARLREAVRRFRLLVPHEVD